MWFSLFLSSEFYVEEKYPFVFCYFVVSDLGLHCLCPILGYATGSIYFNTEKLVYFLCSHFISLLYDTDNTIITHKL